MRGDDMRYWAFISYSHRDKAWGDWLHKAIEGYHLPRRLVGREGRDGPLPRRLFPIFRDREELPSSADLSNNINGSLERSRYLIVICSPRAAVSRWVNEEIHAYKRLGREDRILALVVDGEPNATDRPDSGELECFPPALRHRVGPDGRLLPERVEPIAADARPEGDGKANALLKLLSGLLGVPYDELRQRERQRRRRQRIRWAFAALALVAVITVAWQWEARRRADQAAIAEYTEQGRQLSLSNQPLQAAAYLSEAYLLGGRTPELRLLLARSLRYVDALRATLPQPGIWLFANMPDKKERLATAGGSEEAYAWDLSNGRHLLSLREPGRIQLWAKYSPDGRYIAAGSKVAVIERQMTVRVMDASSGKLLSSHSFDSALLVAAAFSPDSRRLLTRNDGDDKVQVWETVSGRLLAVMDGRGVRMMRAGFSPDGRLVVTANNNNTLSVWDSRSGKMRAYLRGHIGEIRDLEFSPEGRRLASAGVDKSVRVWDLATGRLLFTIAAKNGEDSEGGHQEEVSVVTFSHDGKRLFSASKDKTVRVWDAKTGKNLARLATMPDEIRNLNISDDGSLIAASDIANNTWVWDGGDYSLRAVLPGNTAFFDQDARRLITLSAKDNVAQVWDLPTLLAGIGHVTGGNPRYSPDGMRLATLDSDQVWVWDTRSGKQLLSLHIPPMDPRKYDKAYVSDAQFSPDGRRLLVLASFSPGPSLWNAADGKLIAQMQALHDDVDTAAFTPDGARIFTCDRAKTATVWDGHDGRQLASFAMPDGCIDQLHITPDGMKVAGIRAVESRENRLYRAEVWDLGSRARVLAPPDVLYSYNHGLALSPDGRVLATADNAGIIRLRDLATGALFKSWDSGGGQAEGLYYSPDGKQLSAAFQNGALKAWDAGSSVPQWEYKSGKIGMDIYGYSPDGSFLVTSGNDQAVTLRDAVSGLALLNLVGDSSLTENTAYAPDGLQIASRAYEMPTRLFDIAPETRPSETILQLVRCRVPWHLESGQLLPGAPPGAACPKP